MCAYNQAEFLNIDLIRLNTCVGFLEQVNGVPSCASSDLLRDKLREEWGFRAWAEALEA